MMLLVLVISLLFPAIIILLQAVKKCNRGCRFYNEAIICYKGCIVILSKKALVSFLIAVFLVSGAAALAYAGVFDFFGFYDYFLNMPNSVKAVALVAAFLTLFLLAFFLLNCKQGPSRPAPPVDERTACAVEGSEPAGPPPGVTQHPGGLLAAASRVSPLSGHDVIYEQNGVPYIDGGPPPPPPPPPLDSNFIKLVESVTGSLPPPVPRQEDKPDKAHKGRKG
jgi:hypothetical protein